MKPTTPKRCQAQKKDGHPCDASASRGSDFCFFHDPAQADQRREAQAAGGRNGRMTTLSADAPDVPVQTLRDIVSLVGVTINQVRRGELDPRVANTVGYLANVAIKALEQGDLEDRIAELEAVMKRRQDQPTASALDAIQ